MIKKGLIVSCQAEANSAFNNPNSIVNFAKEAERGGAGIAGVDFAMGKGTLSSDKYNIILERAETQLEHLAS